MIFNIAKTVSKQKQEDLNFHVSASDRYNSNLITIFTFQITGLLHSETISNLSTNHIADVSTTPVPDITTLSSVPTTTIPVSMPHQSTEGKYDEENAKLYCLCNLMMSGMS